MNKDVLKGKWKQISGEAKKKWGKLTDDDLTRAEGDSEKLAGILQEKYGYGKDEADREITDWTESLK